MGKLPYTLITLLFGLILAACQATTPLPPTDTAVANSTAIPENLSTHSPTQPIKTEIPETAPDGEESPESNSSADDLPNADVLFVRAVLATDGTWTFHVTVSHPDTGWEDYADGWDVVTPDETILKKNPSDPFTRLLLHPHVEEQPFTRSQSKIQIPPDVTVLKVRAHDLRAGFGGLEVTVDLEQASGPNYEVVR